MSGLTEVGNDAQFRRHAMHTANFLRTELESYLQYKSASEWVDEFRELQIPCSAVFTIAQGVQFASDIGLEPIQPAGDEQIPSHQASGRLLTQHSHIRESAAKTQR